jgi:hypothetical protein
MIGDSQVTGRRYRGADRDEGQAEYIVRRSLVACSLLMC